MLKKIVIFISFSIIAVLFGGILYSVIQPKEFSWVPTYSNYGRQPYDTYVFYQQLQNFFTEKQTRKLQDTDLEYYYTEEMYDKDTVIDDEYILQVDSIPYFADLGKNEREFNIISVEHFFYTDNLTAKAFLQHLYQGNHALIATEEMSELLMKMLAVKLKFVDLDEEEDSTRIKKRFTLNFADQEPVTFKPHSSFTRIENIPMQAKVITKNALGDIIGIEIPVGKGSIIIFSMPIIFTNYYLLKENYTFAESLLLTLPDKDTYWTKALVGERGYEESRSIMDYIHSQKSLTWAFYTLVFGVLVFLVLQLRRVERPIPIIEKPENISLSFIESVSALFFLKKNNGELVRKKMNYFLDRIRTQYHLDTQIIDERFVLLLSKKLEVKPTLINLIFNLYKEYTSKSIVTDEEFIRFNKLMQTFKIKA